MRNRVFKQDLALYYMLELRRAGATYQQLAQLFNCDFSTIYHHCQRFEIREDYRKPQSKKLYITPNIIHIITGKVLIPNEPSQQQWYVIDNERINKGKSYQEYLNELK